MELDRVYAILTLWICGLVGELFFGWLFWTYELLLHNDVFCYTCLGALLFYLLFGAILVFLSVATCIIYYLESADPD
jgi:hypothetical protein